MQKEKVELILNRRIHPELTSTEFLPIQKGERVLITGADGSIGHALSSRLNEYEGIQVMTTDIVGDHVYMDVTDFQNVFSVVHKFQPTIIINIAGAKHAPLGEREIWKTLSINTIGTMNLIDASSSNCRLILTSTCKANNPEVVYGASKLIAEKMTLSAGGSVARFFNVVETVGNVFEIWDEMPEDEDIKVASDCERHFISVEEAVGLILYTCSAPAGRYAVNSPEKLLMKDIASRVYPDRNKKEIDPRVGDRLIELFKSTSETTVEELLNGSILKLTSVHDQ